MRNAIHIVKPTERQSVSSRRIVDGGSGADGIDPFLTTCSIAIDVAVVFPSSVTLGLEKAQEILLGTFPQLKATVCVEPLSGATEKVTTPG